jgi:hypothetical protein
VTAVDDELTTAPAGRRALALLPYPVVVFVLIAAVLVLWIWGSAQWLDRHPLYPVPPQGFAGSAVLEGWYRFDGGWYRFIADNGYFFTDVSQQSPVAFFPAYPLAIRGVDVLLPDTILSGILITFACGLGASVLFFAWTRDRFDDATARVALLVVLLYPYAWFIFGAVYGDALFLLAALGAFVLFERNHPVLAGLAGAVATATRPVGLAVVVGLIVLTVARRGGLRNWRALRPADAGVLLSFAGLGLWCAYLWSRFGDPLLFSKIQGAEGWDQGEGPRTWLKITFFERLKNLPFWLSDAVSGSTTHHPHPWTESAYTLGVMLQALALIGALVLVPLVIRRLGWGYGAYVLTLLLIPLLGTKDFQGVGRYVLAAFPCFAVVGQGLAKRAAPRLIWLTVSGALLLLLSSAYARGYYVG